MFGPKTGVGKVLLGSAVGMGLALITLLFWPSYFSFVGTLVFGALMAIAGFAGPIAAGIALLLMALALAFWLGPVGVAALIIMVLPCALMLMYMLSHKESVFDGMRVSAITAFVSMVACIFMVNALNGGDALGVVSAYVRDLVYTAEPALRDDFLAALSQIGVVSAPPGSDVLIICAQFAAVFVAYLANILAGSVVKLSLGFGVFGLIAYLWGANKRGFAASLTALPDMYAMRLPPRLNLYLVLAYLVFWVVALLGVQAFAFVSNALWAAIVFLYALQGASVCLWFFSKKRMLQGAGIAIVCVVLLVFDGLLFIIGLIDLLFDFRRRDGAPTGNAMPPPFFKLPRENTQDDEDKEGKI